MRSCIVMNDKKQYNFSFYAKKQLKYLFILRIVLKVVMLYYIYKEMSGYENVESGLMNAEKI